MAGLSGSREPPERYRTLRLQRRTDATGTREA